MLCCWRPLFWYDVKYVVGDTWSLSGRFYRFWIGGLYSPCKLLRFGTLENQRVKEDGGSDLVSSHDLILFGHLCVKSFIALYIYNREPITPNPEVLGSVYHRMSTGLLLIFLFFQLFVDEVIGFGWCLVSFLRGPFWQTCANMQALSWKDWSLCCVVGVGLVQTE